MNETNLCYTPATSLAEMIRKKTLSPVLLVRAVLERIERLNPKLNAFCTLLADQALDQARRAEQAVTKRERLGPLHGIPFTIKDLAVTAGVRTMFGSRALEKNVPAVDAPFVRRLKDAGGIFLGKTTTPEFGWKAIGDSPLTGITRNPWNPGMTTGGSSAGAAASAAAGLGPLHQGSDGAGSIRVPSSFCGIYGLKPTYGRVPMWPTSNTDSVSHTGPMTRTVADAALMMAVMSGPDDWDRHSIDGPVPDFVG
ncbi:MAG TPA: amidase family protein, partial [Methylomirabilota bacterium]|nr:amidase family protein [Methylomirabilota bacterium]